MIDGKPVKRPVNWDKYKSYRLNLESRRTFEEGKHYMSCAAAGLSLVTGINVKTIEKYNPKRNGSGWYTSRIIQFLRMRGFTVVEVSKHKVTMGDQYYPLLGHYHCLIINAKVDKENSLYVVHKGEVYHHFDKQSNAGPLFFINKPTQDVLLVWHKKWAHKKTKAINWAQFKASSSVSSSLPF